MDESKNRLVDDLSQSRFDFPLTIENQKGAPTKENLFVTLNQKKTVLFDLGDYPFLQFEKVQEFGRRCFDV